MLNQIEVMNHKISGYSKIELIILILIVINVIFLAIPMLNSLKEVSKDKINLDTDSKIKQWNSAEDYNQSEVPVKILRDE